MTIVRNQLATVESARRERVEPTGGITATNTQKALEGLDTVTLKSLTFTMPGVWTVTGSPTSGNSPTVAVDLATQTANLLWAGPTSGGAAKPTFRTMVTADIPAATVTYSTIQNVAASRLVGNPTLALAPPSEISVGATLTFNGAALQTLAHSGDVTTPANSFATTIAANAVTYPKFQQVAASSLVGNPTVSLANAQGITVGGTLTFNGTALQTLALTGDVTAAANSFATTVAKIQGTTVTGTTGSGAAVLATSPALVTPTLGVASATSITAANGVTNGFMLTAAAGSNGSLSMGAGGSLIFVLGSTIDTFAVNDHNAVTIFNVSETTPGTATTTTITSPGNLAILNTTAIPAGGTAAKGYLFSSATNFGIFFGSGAPTLAAAKGSLYLRSDGSATNNRAYINTDGSTTWTNLTTAA